MILPTILMLIQAVAVIAFYFDVQSTKYDERVSLVSLGLAISVIKVVLMIPPPEVIYSSSSSLFW